MKSNIFIVSWDMTGLEAVVDVTENVKEGNKFEYEKIWSLLKEPEKEPHNEWVREVNQIVSIMIMRARANTQRHYEIYSIHANKDITAQDLRDLFTADPQSAADLIRVRGTKLYSDRVDQRVQVIV